MTQLYTSLPYLQTGQPVPIALLMSLRQILVGGLFNIVLSVGLYAQTPLAGTSAPGSFTGRIIPPAPKTAGLGTYGQLPVDLNTGAVSVTVPVLQIQSGSLQAPLTLRFNTTGTKVSEVPSWVGQGWQLAASGTVTRIVRGQPDEIPGTGYLDVWPQWHLEDSLSAPNTANWQARKHALEQRAFEQNWDLEADTYNVSAPGLSATLVRDARGRCHLSPDNGWRVSGQPTGGWEFISPDGTRYTFDLAESSHTEGPDGTQQDFYSAWHLTSMVSATGHDGITFLYASDGISMQVSLPQLYQIKFAPVGVRIPELITNNDCMNCRSDPPSAGTLGQNVTTSTVVWRHTYSLSEIRSAMQRIVFHSTVLPHAAAFSQQSSEQPRRLLRKIEELPMASGERHGKSFTFSYRYDGGTFYPGDSATGRHYLTAVTEIGKPPTRFEYYTSSDNRYSDLPLRTSLSQDHWGYFNGASNTSLVPQLPIAWRQFISAPGATRATNPAYLLAGSLQKITYPTGGSTHFFYEPNQVLAPALFDVDQPTLGEKRVGYTALVSGSALPLDSLSQHVHDLLYNSYQGIGVPYVDAKRIDLPEGARSVELETRYTPPSHTGSGPPPTQATPEYCLLKLNMAAADPVFNALILPPILNEPRFSTLSGHGTPPTELPPGSYLLIAVAFDQAASAALSMSCLPQQTPTTSATGLAERTVGGLRIRRMVDHPGGYSTDSVVTTYDYTVLDSLSGRRITTGRLFDVPSYIQTTPCGAVVVTARDNTVLPPTTSGGHHVGYGQVTVTRRGIGVAGATTTCYMNSLEPTSRNLVVRETFTDATGRVVQETSSDHAVNYSLAEVPSVKVQVHSYDKIPMISSDGCSWVTRGTLYNQLSQSHVSAQLTLAKIRQRRYDAATGRYSEQTTTHRYRADVAGRFRPYPSETATVLAPGDTALTWRRFTADYDTINVTNTNSSPARGIAGLLARSASAILVEERQGFGTASGRRWVNGSITEFSALLPKRQLELATQFPISALPPSRIGNGTWERALAYRPSIEYDLYSATGKQLQLHRAHSTPVSMIWGGEQLITECLNASYEAVAYTSFELRGSGRWRFDSLRTGSTAFAGRLGYRLDDTYAGRIQSPALPAGDYQLLVWVKGEDYPIITGGIVRRQTLVRQAANGWRLQRFTLALLPNTSLRLSAQPGLALWIDELRLHPIGAQMTTYTHEPLVGLTSQTDPSGRTIFYEYDGLGRLLRVRDEQGHVLTEQEYKYSAQR